MAFEGSEEEAQAEELKTQPWASVWPLPAAACGQNIFSNLPAVLQKSGWISLSIHQRAQYGLDIWLAYIIFDSGKQC